MLRHFRGRCQLRLHLDLLRQQNESRNVCVEPAFLGADFYRLE